MIRVGIGGWVFKPWRGTFYPSGLTQARELDYASRAVTTIEINGTFYGTQKPESFRRWAQETPDDFVFSLKGPRFATHRRDLAGAGESIERFFASGVAELQSKLGPVLWQLPPAKAFEPDDFAAFLALLPKRIEGRTVRHAVEVRHQSFCAAEFVALMRESAVAIALIDFRSRIPRSPTSPATLSICVCSAPRKPSRPAMMRPRSLPGPAVCAPLRLVACRPICPPWRSRPNLLANATPSST